ncbi:MAG: hypothetical protein NC930_01045 [Candidatus Omnitrophica bacterium]|nr:hypothetical protein [Candidatus Omnitrophota bacterium]
MKKKDKAEDNCLYFDITKQERDSAIRYLLGAIINTRQKCGFPSNRYVYDEDVNIYLAHLLFAVSLPEYHEMAEPYLSNETSDILRWVRATEDRTIRYFIFKVNADHILVDSAIFDNLNRGLGDKIFKYSEKHYQEVGKLYYDQAAAYHKRIYRKKTGVGEVLEKLAHYFENYQRMLKEVRREYFQFLNSFRDQAFHYFLKEIQQYENDISKKVKLDRFLDLYGNWLETKNPELKTEIISLVTELRRLDPNFTFDTIQAFENDNDGDIHDERECA